MERSDKLADKIIQSYNDELNKYKELVGPGLKKLLDEERTLYLKQLNALYDIHMFQNYLIDYQSACFSKNRTLSLFFSKVAGNIFSLRQCLMVGQLVSASSIERNIFETYVDTRLILEKDTEERCLLYENFQHVLLGERVKTYKKYLKGLDNDETVDDKKRKEEKEYFENLYKDIDIDTIESNYQNVKEDYHPKYPHHWAWKIFKDEIKGQGNPNLKFLCKKLGIYNDYLHVYATSSLEVHNHPLLANMMIRNGNLTSAPVFSDATGSIAGISASLVIEIILDILEYSKSKKYDEIGLFLSHLFKKSFIDN